MEKRSENDFAVITLAIDFGLAAAYVDSIRTPFNLWLTAAALFFLCLALGYIEPRHAYRSALIAGSCVLLVFLARRYNDSASLNILKAIPTLIPSMVGACCGVMLRKVFSGPLAT